MTPGGLQDVDVTLHSRKQLPSVTREDNDTRQNGALDDMLLNLSRKFFGER